MVKKIWVLIALVAGLVLGSFLTTFGAYVLGFSTAEADGWTARVAAKQPHASALPGASAESPPLPDVVAPPGPAAAPASTPVHEKIASPAPANATPTGAVAFVAGDYVDAPPGKQIQYEDPLHVEFLQEVRDDSWAYLREAELENAMVMELSEGRFKKERIECRASICEVELSATGDQVAKLSEWMEQKHKQRSFSLEEPLLMRGTSFRGDGTTGQARILYMKPERVLSPPRKG